MIIAMMLFAPCLSAFDSAEAEDRHAELDTMNFERFVVPPRSVSEGLRLAERYQEPTTRANFLFRLAYVYQNEGNWTDRPELLERAKSWYRDCLRYAPGSVPAAVNLADIYSRAGRHDSSIIALRGVLASKANEAGIVYLRLAREYAALSRWRDGLAALDQALATMQYVSLVDSSLVKPFARRASSDLVELIEKLIDDDRSGQAFQLSTAVFDCRLLSASPEFLQRVMVALVKALSRQRVDPDLVDSTKFGRTLARLADHSYAGRGMADLLDLYHRILKPPGDYTFWVESAVSWEPKFNPRFALAEFLNGLGQHYQGSARGLALGYYRLALELGQDRPDPLAVLNLADLYAANGDYAAFEGVVRRWTPQLFEGKSDAYRRSDLKRIYTYHRALGLIFANVESRSSARTGIQSAEFQLEHAIQTARTYNQSGPNGDSIFVEPELIGQLAKAMERNGRQSQAQALRLDSWDRYLSSNNVKAAGTMAEIIKQSSTRIPSKLIPTTPRPVSPTPGEVLGTPVVTFEVQSREASKPLTYEFEVYTADSSMLLASVAGKAGDANLCSWQFPDSSLAGGEYAWRARADYHGIKSAWSSLQRYKVDTATEAHAYPNPWRISQGGHVTFVCPDGLSTLVIMTVGGDLVIRKEQIHGQWEWDGVNAQGQRVSAGTYLWHLEGSSEGRKLLVLP